MASVLKNLLPSAYGTAAIAASQVLLVPLYIHFWGATKYGTWLVLTAIPTYISLADFGVGMALGNSLTVHLEKREFERAQGLLGVALRYQVFVTLGLVLISLLLASLAPLQTWINLENVPTPSFRLTLMALTLYSLLPLHLSCLSGAFRACGSYPKYLYLQGHTKVVEAVVTAVVVVASGDLHHLAFALLAIRVGSVLQASLLLQKNSGRLRVTWKGGTWGEYKNLIQVGIGFFAFPVGGLLINQATVLLVNGISGPRQVVELTVCRQFCRTFLQITSIITTSVHPELTRAFAVEDLRRFLSLQAKAFAAILLSSIGFLCLVGLFGPEVILIWTGGLVVGTTTILTLALESVTAGIGNTLILGPWAASRLGALPGWYLAFQAIGLSISAALYPMLNTTGIGFGFVVVNIVFAALIINSILRLSNIQLRVFGLEMMTAAHYFIKIYLPQKTSSAPKSK